MRTVRAARAIFTARHLPLEPAGTHPFGRARSLLYLEVKPHLRASNGGVRVSRDDFVVIVFPTPVAARRTLDDPYVRKALAQNHEPAVRNGNLVLASRVPVGRRYHNVADWRAARQALARVGR
jgi:UDP-N-acetyl-D-mannosaminuronate dehydrogenase